MFVGKSVGDARDYATSLHNSLVAPSRSVLVMVDPEARAIEVVTGAWVRRRLSDLQVELAVAAMARSFGEGDLVGGLRNGINQLAEHARLQTTLHAGSDTPLSQS